MWPLYVLLIIAIVAVAVVIWDDRRGRQDYESPRRQDPEQSKQVSRNGGQNGYVAKPREVVPRRKSRTELQATPTPGDLIYPPIVWRRNYITTGVFSNVDSSALGADEVAEARLVIERTADVSATDQHSLSDRDFRHSEDQSDHSSPVTQHRQRVTHCWRCKGHLDSREDSACSICSAIRCSCGACLCGRRRRRRWR